MHERYGTTVISCNGISSPQGGLAFSAFTRVYDALWPSLFAGASVIRRPVARFETAGYGARAPNPPYGLAMVH